ncbi:MAG: futalosine hydrolase [Planctomycetota bacterium]|nr:futalosine hydrolase [Planctomycetota bacterium]
MRPSTFLLLVPTAGERRVVEQAIGSRGAERLRIELCGFGPIAAAARAAHLLAALKPASVMLVGIAGAMDDRLAIGQAYRFDEVVSYGVGVGTGSDFQQALSLGWSQWPGDSSVGQQAIGDRIVRTGTATGHVLLTACAASAGPADVAARRALIPDAVAEDMEGFGVAVACELAGVPWTIIRGISNRAGDRDHSQWCVEPALEAAAALAHETLAEAP